MILHWSQRREPLLLQWRGPNRITSKAITTIDQVEDYIAVIMGPKGNDGEKGDKGDRGEPGPVSTSTEVTSVDGGFF